MVSDDDTVADDASVRAIDRVVHGSSADMSAVPDGSVALVVTSPPYFAGKAYETELDAEHVPATYVEYLEMLRAVFAECVRTLEPGGRIAVNVANLGRRPYRSLAADVTSILQDDLRLLLRGEIVWVKQRGASGSCAWGSFQRATNPVLRDLTERVVVASKGRFDRAVPQAERERRGLPAASTMYRDEFMESTLDLWEIAPESARRVGHPAPFPVALPERLIHLYTYAGDLVLDPFLGSGSTAVAAVRAGRHYVGYDTDADYVARAEERIAEERERPRPTRPRVPASASGPRGRTERAGEPSTAQAPPLGPDAVDAPPDAIAAAASEGTAAKDLALQLLTEAGFADVRTPAKHHGIDFAASVLDATGRELFVSVSGSFAAPGNGLRRADVLWRELGRAAAVAAIADPGSGRCPVVLLSTDAPGPTSTGGRALVAARDSGALMDVLLVDRRGLEVLGQLAKGLAPGEDGWVADGPLGAARGAA